MKSLLNYFNEISNIKESESFEEIGNTVCGDDMIISCSSLEMRGQTKYYIFVIDPLGLKDTERYEFDDESTALSNYKKLVKKHK